MAATLQLLELIASCSAHLSSFLLKSYHQHMLLPWILLGTLSLAFVAVPRQELAPLPELAERLLAAFEPDDRQRLLATYERARANPTDGELNGQMAMLLHAFGQYELASRFYHRARSLEPSNFRWAYYLGLGLAAVGQEGQAIPVLRAAVELDENYLPAQLKLAELLGTLGDWNESRRIYGDVVHRYPDNARAHYGLGRIQFARGEAQAALSSYRKASRLSPDFAAAHYGLAMVYRSLSDVQKARRHLLLFERSRGTQPPLEDPLLDLIGQLHSRAEYHYLQGLEFQNRGQIPQALDEYERALEEDPQHAMAHANLFFSYLTLGDLEKAEQHYQAALKLDPRLHEIHHNLGILRRLQNRDQEAAGAFQRALELNPFRAESHYLLGTILSDDGQWGEAERRFRLAIQNQPEFRDAHLRLGLLLQKQERDEEALPHFLKTLTVEDESTPVCLYVLARSYARLGHLGKAIDSAAQAREKALSAGEGELAADLQKFLEQLEQVRKRQ